MAANQPRPSRARASASQAKPAPPPRKSAVKTPSASSRCSSHSSTEDFDLVLAGWLGDFKDPVTYLDLFVTDGGNNYGSYSNPKYDELLRKIKSTSDQSVRVPAMIELEGIIAEETPVLVLRNRVQNYLINPKVKGLDITAIGGQYILRNIDVEK